MHQTSSQTLWALAALALLGTLACGPPPETTRRADEVAASLLRVCTDGDPASLAGSSELPGVVRVGEGLAAKLDELCPPADACTTEVEVGDAPEPMGDSRGTHRVFLTCDGSETLGIRLRYDENIDEFHLLGYWTPRR